MTTDPMAQDVIRCDLCTGKPVPSPVDVVCNTCNVNLCNACLVQHVSSKLSIKHDIVGFIFKTTDVPSVSCQLHSNLKCDVQCRNCHIPLCPKCLSSGSHKHHDVIEISEIFASLKQTIKEDADELENFIVPVYENRQLELRTNELKLSEGYDDFKKSILQQGKEWHEEVDNVIKKNLAKAEQMQRDDLSLLRKLQSDANDQLLKVRQQVEKNKDFLESNAGTEIMNYKSQNDQFRRVPPCFELSPPTFSPVKIQAERFNQMFGELKPSARIEKEGYTIPTSRASSPPEKQFLKNVSITHKIKADMFVSNVCCVPNTNQCIVRYRAFMKRLDIKGTKIETVTSISGKSGDIVPVITKKGNFLYSDRDDRSINMVKNGKIDTIIKLLDWKPLAICSTSSDDLLVTMTADDEMQSKVVRYAGSTVTQEIQFDDNAKPLYKSPCFIAENKNLQVCVLDYALCTVVVTDKTGKAMFRYNGNLSSKKDKTFAPNGLATDSICHILVADSRNKCVHIISHEGQFLRYIDNCDLLVPNDLSISIDGMLYIADFTPEVKVVKYRP